MNSTKEISDVIKEIELSQEAEYHRGKSWEHCYLFFRDYKKDYDKLGKNEESLNLAALNIGFFLASWGMLRGSSFLIQKDYRFYKPLIEVLTNSDYNRLWGIDFSQKTDGGDIKKLFNLKSRLEEQIRENNKKDKDFEEHKMTLLVTKIIMATIGCVPSYDKYFINGLTKKNKDKKELSVFGEEQFKDLLEYSRNDTELKKIYTTKCYIKDSTRKNTDIVHPPMKILDLYFWLIGKESEE